MLNRKSHLQFFLKYIIFSPNIFPSTIFFASIQSNNLQQTFVWHKFHKIRFPLFMIFLKILPNLDAANWKAS